MGRAVSAIAKLVAGSDNRLTAAGRFEDIFPPFDMPKPQKPKRPWQDMQNAFEDMLHENGVLISARIIISDGRYRQWGAAFIKKLNQVTGLNFRDEGWLDESYRWPYYGWKIKDSKHNVFALNFLDSPSGLNYDFVNLQGADGILAYGEGAKPKQQGGILVKTNGELIEVIKQHCK